MLRQLVTADEFFSRLTTVRVVGDWRDGLADSRLAMAETAKHRLDFLNQFASVSIEF